MDDRQPYLLLMNNPNNDRQPYSLQGQHYELIHLMDMISKGMREAGITDADIDAVLNEK